MAAGTNFGVERYGGRGRNSFVRRRLFVPKTLSFMHAFVSPTTSTITWCPLPLTPTRAEKEGTRSRHLFYYVGGRVSARDASVTSANIKNLWLTWARAPSPPFLKARPSARPPLARPLAITLEGHKTRLTSAAAVGHRVVHHRSTCTWLAAAIPFRTVPGMYAVLFHVLYVALDFRELHRYETVPRAAITVTRLFGLRFGRMTMK